LPGCVRTPRPKCCVRCSTKDAGRPASLESINEATVLLTDTDFHRVPADPKPLPGLRVLGVGKDAFHKTLDRVVPLLAAKSPVPVPDSSGALVYQHTPAPAHRRHVHG
jgi:hypothetical protein